MSSERWSQAQQAVFLLATLCLFALTKSPLAELANGFNRDNYVISHLGIELLSIFVFVSCVGILLQPLHHQEHYYSNSIIVGYLTVALLDFAHAVSYEGMPVFFTPSSTQKSIFFWLAARVAELLTFAFIALRLRLPGTKKSWCFVAIVLVSLIFYSGNFHLDYFPDLFYPGVGVSQFKTRMEYLLFIGNLIISLVFLLRYRKSQLSQNLLFSASAYCMALCSLSLTDYVEASDFSLLVGHLFKFVSAVLIYKGIFWSELKKPYEKLRIAEAKAANKELELDTILRNAPIGVMRLDTALHCTYANKFMQAAAVGLTQQAGFYSPARPLPTDAMSFFEPHLRQVIAGGEAEFKWEYPQNGGTTRYFDIKAVPELSGSNQINSLLCLISDVSATVVAAQAKLQAEKEVQDLQAALDEHAIVAFTDAQGVITAVNDKFCQISGYSRAELLGKTHRIINSGYHDPVFFKDMWKVLSRGGNWHGEICNRAKDGSLYWVSTTIVPYLNEAGHIQQFIAIRADITERKQAEMEAKRLALYDDLTGLPNRRSLKEQINRLCWEQEQEQQYHALLLLDLDNFKEVNDSFGHVIGDDLLKQIALRVQQFTTSAEHCARLGGDEFVVLLPNIGDDAEVASRLLMHTADDICKALAEPYLLNGKLVRTSASIGISLFNGRMKDTAEVLKQADIALYQSKANGRNCVTFFDPVLQSAMDKRNEILRELKTALERNELYLHYQPIFNDHKMTGVEALVRWHNAVLGNISPAVFIPLAEESNLILDIGQWVLDSACQQIKQWSHDPVCADWSVAVNVSAKQLLKDNFASLVQDCIDKHQIKPQNLQLEITESMLQGEVKTTTKTMRTLKALGIRFSLDDFGTGYSSLNYLTKLPIDTLKVDKSFVDYMLTSEEDASVVSTIISLAKSLKLDVVAEGVETAEQFEFLQQLNCDKFQGYFFSKPVPTAQLATAAEFYYRTSQSDTALNGKSNREL